MGFGAGSGVNRGQRTESTMTDTELQPPTPLTPTTYARLLRAEADAILAARGIVTRLTLAVMTEVRRER